MENLLSEVEGAEVFVELLNANNVDYIFLNPGTDIAPIQEAAAKFKALGKRTPEIVLCLHETIAMEAAIGHFMVSGRPQVVLVHGDLGTQQVGGALHNAQRARAAVILCAGRAATIGIEGKRGGRNQRREWLQDTLDQSGTVRNYVKWDYMLWTTENISEVVQRAFQVATTEPCGPVYLTFPREVLMEKVAQVAIPSPKRFPAAASPQADLNLLAEVAELLLKARQPLIITGYSGRNTSSVASLVELAEVLGARVISSELRMNFPLRHPLCAGIVASKGTINPGYFMEADVILVLDHDVPYMPSSGQPKPDTKIIQIDIDPVKQDFPLWGLPIDILLEADSSKALPALTALVKSKITPELRTRFQTRFKQIAGEHEQIRARWNSTATAKATQKPVAGEWLSYCINQVVDEDTILLSEVVSDVATVARQIERSKPGTLFANSGANLGWGLGASLGAKLAAPDKTVVSLISDGSFVFGCPIAALWASCKNNAPFLTIIYNNQKYGAVESCFHGLYGEDSFCVSKSIWTGCDITPSPDYALVARACGAYSSTVEDPSQIVPALQEALGQVKSGRTAVVDVRME